MLAEIVLQYIGSQCHVARQLHVLLSLQTHFQELIVTQLKSSFQSRYQTLDVDSRPRLVHDVSVFLTSHFIVDI